MQKRMDVKIHTQWCLTCIALTVAAMYMYTYQRRMKMTKAQEFWAWIDQCPDGVYVNHDFTDDEDDQKIHIFGFAVPKEIDNDDA